MEFKSNEIKVGATIFVSLTLLVVFLVAIFSINVGEEFVEYQTYLNYVGGIQKGSLVKFGGMDVGVVTEISLPETARRGIWLRLKIDDKTPVRMDSEAFLTSVGIMADQHIEISSGSLDAPLLEPGSVLKNKDVVGFMQMAEPLSALSDQVQELLSSLNQVLSVKNRSHLSSMVANMDSMLADGRANFLKLTENLDAMTGNLAAISGDLNDLMGRNQGSFDSTLSNVEVTTRETSQLIIDLRATLAKFENLVSANGSSMVDIIENFQFASQNFEEFTRLVKERPWLLIRKDAPPKRKTP